MGGRKIMNKEREQRRIPLSQWLEMHGEKPMTFEETFKR